MSAIDPVGASATPTQPGRARIDLWLAFILLAGGLLRLHLAMTTPYYHDEKEIHIRVAKSISFSTDNLNLPLRGLNHPALVGYVIKASSALFGSSRLGYRVMHLLAGLFTILLVFRITNQWYGPPAARWAAALLAFNEYHIGVSGIATSHAPHLLSVVLAVYAFQRFLGTRRVAYLYGAGVAAGMAFYVKEHSVLLLGAFLLTLFRAEHRTWLRSWHPYLACGLFLVLIAPDVAWNLDGSRDAARATVAFVDGPQATYADHLARVGSIGFSPYPLAFFGRDTFVWLYELTTGSQFRDAIAEYRSMNSLLGVLLLGGVVAMAWRPPVAGGIRGFLLMLFWVVLGFFLCVRPGEQSRLDSVSWSWVDMSLLPSAILAGVWLSAANTNRRIAVRIAVCAAMLYAALRAVS